MPLRALRSPSFLPLLLHLWLLLSPHLPPLLLLLLSWAPRLKIDDWDQPGRDGVVGSFIGDDEHYGHCCARLKHTANPFEYGGRNWSKCEGDGTLIQCYGCPRTFHRQCLPTPFARRWLCDLCESVGDQLLMPSCA